MADIKDIRFDGEACAISTASTSIMIKNLIGKNIKDAKDYINNFTNITFHYYNPLSVSISPSRPIIFSKIAICSGDRSLYAISFLPFI